MLSLQGGAKEKGLAKEMQGYRSLCSSMRTPGKSSALISGKDCSFTQLFKTAAKHRLTLRSNPQDSLLPAPEGISIYFYLV